MKVGCGESLGFSIVSEIWEMQMGVRACLLAPQCCPLSLSAQGPLSLNQ